ncbi:hypothetical protein [Microbacterium sp.]|uniref:hypothetical protein n=1 Tax=Microbacterium sp. TaxID=51671 RepID=UPI003F97F0FA
MFTATIAPVIGLILAMLWVGVRPPRGAVGVSAGVRGFTLVGVGVALVGALIVTLSGNTAYSSVSSPLTWVPGDWLYVAPLVAGIIGVLVLMLPLRRRASTGSAQLTRRTAFSFARRWWLVLAGSLIGIIVVLSLAAGSASSPDELGRYRLFALDAGAAEIRIPIYGWYYALPSLIALALFAGATLVALSVIAHPPLDADSFRDTTVRKERTRNVLGVLVGGLLLHLGTVLAFLGHTGTSSVGVLQGEDVIPIIAPFAAFGPLLWFLGGAASVLGFGCWFEIVLSSVRRPARQRVDAV